MSHDSRQPLFPVAVTMAVGLLNAAGICDWICRIPPRGSSLWGLTIRALLYVAIAALVHMAAIRIFTQAFRDHFSVPPWPEIGLSWPCSVWMPALVLLLKSESIFAVLLPPIIAVLATGFVVRMQAGPEARVVLEPAHLFRMLPSPPMLETMVPAFASSVAFESGVGSLAGSDYLAAGLLFGFGMVFPIWRLKTAGPDGAFAFRRGIRFSQRQSEILSVVAAFALTLFVLLPSGRNRRFDAELNALLQAAKANAKAKPVKTQPVNRPLGSGYTGVVLLLPPKPKDKIEAPAPVDQTLAHTAKARPLVIPFDGVYWFFKFPDLKPKADAVVTHGDPIKANVRSTDKLPISMEAHQPLATPLKMDCCRAIRVELVNADNRLGAISVEIVLRSISRTGIVSQSLGSQVLPSSELERIPADRQPVNETLTFPMPRHARGKLFNEISILVQPSRERALVGARIAVQQFVLAP